MEKTLIEQTQETLERTFTKYETLKAQERELWDWIEKVEEQQATVSDKIYQKVKKEYKKQLADIESELGPLADELAAARETTTKQLSSLEDELGALEEQHSETVLRHRVGEYSEQKLKSIEQSLFPQIEELRNQKEPLTNLLERIESITPQKPSDKKATTGSEGKKKVAKDKAADAAKDEPELDTEGDSAKTGDSISELADPVHDASDSSLADPSAESHEDSSFDTLLDSFVDAPGDPSTNESSDENKAAETDNEAESKSEDHTIPFPNLIIISGSQSGKKIPLLPMTMTIGREHDNNIELKDEEVARYHARIIYENCKFMLNDLSSSTGTWVNDEKITETVLKNSDKIRLGSTEMVIDFS